MSEAPLVRRVVETVLPTAHGLFRLYGYVADDGQEHVALASGDVTASEPNPVLVRVHSECLTGDALGSWRCDCGEQLDAALQEIGRVGAGVLIYLRGHEGRGIGLGAKLQAYALQDVGLDTVDANLQLGLPVDARAYDVAASILADLGVRRIRLLTANPDKSARLQALGVEVVSRHRLRVTERTENGRYLFTKRTRMGHDTESALPDVWSELLAGRVPDRTLAGPDVALLERYGPLVVAGRRLRIGQLAQSADGFIASRAGDASYVSGPEDREHLHRLRALVDAVVVGVGTVVADDPQLTTRAVQGSSPVRVVLDPAARTPRKARVLTDRAAPTLWCVTAQPPFPVVDGVEVVVLPGRPVDGWFVPAALLAELAARGLGRVLVEGGGRTVSAFLAAGVLDRLYLTTAPRLIGDGVPGIRFPGSDRLAEAITAPVLRFALGGDLCTVFDFASKGSKVSGAGRSG